jgi:hypothetical protein
MGGVDRGCELMTSSAVKGCGFSGIVLLLLRLLFRRLPTDIISGSRKDGGRALDAGLAPF